MTQDHSLMNELVARGFYTPQEAQRASAKNYVTRALGVEPTVEVDVADVPVEKDDLFLLCSDGLSDMVEHEDIQLTMSTFGANLQTLARQLVLLGNDNGGRDNISVVLVRVLDSFPAPPRRAAEHPRDVRLNSTQGDAWPGSFSASMGNCSPSTT